jgi:16S rRNA (adenine1518-N6/adenine1519-N6)-dimethyltransferase
VARQRLGQHFLASEAWREKIARAVLPPSVKADSRAGGVWIEIGAGHGEMTTLLAGYAGRLITIELDEKLLPGLYALAERLGNASVISGDVLLLDLAKLAAGKSYHVYGNIPYYITSPIVHHLFAGDKPEAAFLVMQLEVAARLTARPGSRDYGYLSAFTQFYAHSEILLRIPPGAFRPPPKVASALVSLRVPGEGSALGVNDEPAFIEFLKTCFSQKRKTLRNNLRAMALDGRAAELLEECGIRSDARAEQLGLPEMARLFARVQQLGERWEHRPSGR